MPKKVLICGSSGQLGSKLSEVLSKNFELILTDREQLDITDSKKVKAFVSKISPDVIVNCAAYTAVDKAEEEKEVCYKINVEGASNLARAAAKIGSVAIYISTDYVFDGKKNSPYEEMDRTHPLSIYGRSKLEGEEATQECPKHYIIRTAWLFGETPEQRNLNFVEKMLELSASRKELKVVDDQIGSPTYTGDLSEAIKLLISPAPRSLPAAPYGVFHFSGDGEASWFDFAKEIFRQTDRKVELLPVKSGAFPSKAKRPSYSYLDKSKFERLLNRKVRPWQEMLSSYLQEASS